jgi:hypothetical protein
MIHSANYLMFSPERVASEATGHVCEMARVDRKQNNMFSKIGIRVTPNSFARSNLRGSGMRSQRLVGIFWGATAGGIF